jgi:lipoprotein-anchoring transpeptidase ErfK/SrfK
VAGSPWVRVRIPGRPNGRTGWVRADALGLLQVVRTQLVVDRRTAHATLYRAGRPIWRAPVGVGAPGTPTPAGRFYIRELLRAPGGVYGPWAFGTSAYSSLSDWPGGGVIGVHGTNQPQLIPGRPSHGCIRVRNADIVRLVRLMPIGTPVHIV